MSELHTHPLLFSLFVLLVALFMFISAAENIFPDVIAPENSVILLFQTFWEELTPLRSGAL